MGQHRSGSRFVLTAALLAVLAAGCGPQTPQERGFGIRSTDPQQQTAIERDRNDDVIDRQAPPIEDRDYFMGRNQNPHLVSGHWSVRNQGVDINNMQMMAKSVPGVERATITINGGNAYVSLDLIPNVTAAQARDIERQVIAALRQKVPRYDFHVTSNDGYHGNNNGGK